MKAFVLKHAPIIIATVVIAAVCQLVLRDNPFFARLEWISYDWRVRQAARFPENVFTNLGFVEISDSSITHVEDQSIGFDFGLYWPRQIYGRVVRELSAQGAKIVAFDVLFDHLRPDHATVLLADGRDMPSDDWFAARMKEAGNVLIASEKGVLPPSLFQENAAYMGNISADRDADGTLRKVKAFQNYRVWDAIFQRIQEDPRFGVQLSNAVIRSNILVIPRSGGEKAIQVPLNEKGEFDRQEFLVDKISEGGQRFAKPFTEERMWHMGIVMAAVELGLDLTHPVIDLDHGYVTLFGKNRLVREIPVDSEGYFYVNWLLTTQNTNLLSQPFEAVLALDQDRHGHPSEMADQWKGRINWTNKLVIIGSTATGNDLTDLGNTPQQENAYLVGVHWNVANSVIMGSFIHTTSLQVELMLVVVMGLLAAYITWALRSYVASLWILLLFGIYFAVVLYLFVGYHLWVPLVPPLVGGVLTHFLMLAYMLFFEQVQKRRIRLMFDKFVSSDVVTEVLEREEENELSRAGEPRRLTVFFSDIRGFTELTDVNQERAEKYIASKGLQGDDARKVREVAAGETLETVNTYLETVADVVLKHNGHIDKFIGDCVMAFWPPPKKANPQHALSCVRAAIEAQRAVHNLNLSRAAENLLRAEKNRALEAEGKRPLSILPILVVGTGINTGDVTAGNMGTKDRLNYTAFGREVNLASRLESVSGHARIIISQETLNEIRKFDPALADACKPLPPETVKGIRHPVPIFEVPWREEAKQSDSPP